MKKNCLITFLLIASAALCSCGKLSKEAKAIVGTYYNTEVSQSEPVMVLKKNADCVVTAIKPGVLTYSVKGTWNVKNDSLIMELDPTSITYEGDSTYIGTVPTYMARKIVGSTMFALQLEKDGVSYMYQRRNE